MITLRSLTPKDEAAFLKGATEWSVDDASWYSFDWKPGGNYLAMLEKLAKNETGVEIPREFVPSTMLYAFNEDGAIVGRVHFRHRLNESLSRRGGHIGYAVAPRYRRRGYATEMLRQALQYARDVLKLDQVLLSCADTNEASARMIEKEGGRLEDKTFDYVANELTRRYWIKLV